MLDFFQKLFKGNKPGVNEKEFIKIVKCSRNIHYGIDCNGTFWRLDKLARNGGTYRMVKGNSRSGHRREQRRKIAKLQRAA